MALNVYEQVKKALQDIVAPELNGIKVEIKRLDEKIDTKFGSLDEKIETRFNSLQMEISSLRSELLSEIRRLDGRIDALNDKLDTAIDLRERIVALEERLRLFPQGAAR